jgi:hypothetical protein
VSTIIPVPGPRGQWRVLLLDREPGDPHWLIASVATPEHIRPTTLDPIGRYQDWPLVTAWTAARLGGPVELTPIHDPLVWTIHNPRRPA